MLAGPLWAAAPPDDSLSITLSRAPYLQQVTDRSALVVWRTATAAACTLAYSPAGGPVATVVTSSATEHVVALNGLQPATRYDYTIRSAGLLAGGTDTYIRTAPLPGTGTPVRLLVWGDSGTGTAGQMAVAAALNAQSADVGLHVGDIIYPGGEPQHYNPRYFTPYAPMLRHMPVWATLGNHDAANTSSFLDAWHLPTNSVNGSERFYSFDYGDIHIVALDTNASFSSTILNWLNADLSGTTRAWKMVFFHHTMYSCGDYHGSSTSLINTLAPIFDAHGVDVVFYGHDHHYERTYPMFARQKVGIEMEPDYTNPAGTIYVVSGGGAGARAIGTSCSHTARAVAVQSFVRAEVAGDRLTLEAVDTSQQVFDRMTIHKTNLPPPPPPPPPADSIHVLHPVGGESLTLGIAADLRWNASAGVGPVRVELSRATTSGPWETLFDSTPNDGSETWTTAGNASAHCWMRISKATTGDPFDLSDASFAIVAQPDTGGVQPPPGSAVRINFQPATAPVPAGYGVDSGLPFDAALGFGWRTPIAMRERGMLPGNPRDTFADVVNNGPQAIWEFSIPNGAYRVSLICGDATTTATHRVALEGQVVVQDVATAPGQFLEKNDVPVLVTDTKLTLTLGAGGGSEITHTKVNAILVTAGTGPVHILTSPAGGETYCVGYSVPLRWTGAIAGGLVRLDISRQGGAGAWETLGLMPDDGQENWGASGPPASNCLLRLVDQDGNTLSQTAETFAIAESQLQLLHPNGGEIWATGTDRSFEWTSTCFTGNVRIDVSRSGPGGPWTVLLPSTPNDGFETYNVRPSDIGFVHARIVALPLGLPLDQCDAGFAIVDHEPPVQPQSGWHFDFLPAGAAPAPGYEAESGQPYDAAHGHGWNTAQVTKKRSMLADDSRDDFVQVVNNTTATWKLDLPNGAYEVSFVCGDPYTSGTHRVALENHLVVTDVYASGGTYVTRSNLPVTVLDGQLTVTLGGNGQITSTKLCGIDVRTVPSRQPRQRPKEQAPDSRSIGAVRWMNRLEMESRPFRDRAHFNLEFATDTAARVTVHDVRGRRVAMLHQGAMARGPHAMVWEPVDDHGRRLPSGVYFLQVESPLLQVSRKLVLVR